MERSKSSPSFPLFLAKKCPENVPPKDGFQRSIGLLESTFVSWHLNSGDRRPIFFPPLVSPPPPPPCGLINAPPPLATWGHFSSSFSSDWTSWVRPPDLTVWTLLHHQGKRKVVVEEEVDDFFSRGRDSLLGGLKMHGATGINGELEYTSLQFDVHLTYLDKKNG